MKNVLVVIDMQNDFIDGALGTTEAVQAVGNVVSLIQNPYYDTVLATLDTHGLDYMDTMEGKYLPVAHCIKGTHGWQLNDDVAKALFDRHARLFEKPTFGSTELADYLAKEKPETITLCGVCTDICVLSNAILIKSHLYETPIAAVGIACAATTKENHEAALKMMKSCQIEIKEEL